METTEAVMSERVRALLVCPLCRGELEDLPAYLACAACGLAFPVVEGVPWMIRERARKLDKVLMDRPGVRR